MNETILNPGDVLLLTPEWLRAKTDNRGELRQDCVSLLICELDESSVSHVALYYGKYKGTHLMVEEHFDGLQVVELPKPASMRTVYAHRCDKDLFNPQKVISAANDYLANEEPYAFGTLITTGFLLLSGRFVKEAEYINMVTKALLKICDLLLSFHSDTTPMTCAQFVAACYGKGGAALFPDSLNGARTVGGRVLDCASLGGLALMKLRRDKARPLVWQKKSPTPQAGEMFRAVLDGSAELEAGTRMHNDFELLCCIILHWLRETDKPAAAQLPAAPESGAKDMNLLSDEFVNAATRFVSLAMNGRTHSDSGPPTPEQAALDMEKLSNSFISPGDLQRCSRLRNVGEIPSNSFAASPGVRKTFGKQIARA